MRSLITRIVAAVLALILALGAALVVSTTTQGQLVTALTRINQGYVPVTRQLTLLSEELRAFVRLLSSREPSSLRQSLQTSEALFPLQERSEHRLLTLIDQIDNLLLEDLDPGDDNFMINLRGASKILLVDIRAMGPMIEDLNLALSETPPRLEPAFEALTDHLIGLERRVETLANLASRRTELAIERVEGEKEAVFNRLLTVSLGATVLALLILLVIARSLAPIRELTRLAVQLKEGNYQAASIQAGRDEIGVLAREFVTMAQVIQERDSLLRTQKAALEDAYAQLVQAQRAQVQAERLAAVGELAAHITHELRNPLSSIGLNAEMLGDELQQEQPDSAEALEMLHAIEREIVRLTELTDRYLSMARNDEPQRRPVDLVNLVGDVLDQFAIEHSRHGARVDTRLPATLVAEVDESLIRQVLINLFRNAVEALGGGDRQELRISLEAQGASFVLRVEDSGAGIDPGEVDSIFEPFVTSRERGTGLGLSISRQIARSHGGELTAQRSQDLGGACFSLCLPLGAPAVGG